MSEGQARVTDNGGAQKRRRLLRFSCVLLLAAAFGSVAAGVRPARAKVRPTHYAIVLKTLTQHVIPHFTALREAAKELVPAVDAVCSGGGHVAQAQLKTAFRRMVKAWAGVDYLRFGPMLEGARRERMAFWPDPRGFMKRQLAQLIAAGDENQISNADQMAQQSAAVQGLPALEALMTNKKTPLGPAEAGHTRCRLAKAIAANVTNIANGLYEDWTKEGGWKDKMLRPGSDNDTYKEPQEAANELVKAFLTGLSLVGDGEVKPRLDQKQKFRPPYKASGASGDYFVGGVTSLASLYDAMDLEAFLPEDKAWVKDWTGGAWRALKASDGAGGAIAGVPAEDAPPLRKVHAMFVGLRKVTLAELSPAARLTVGFNELDGD